MELSTLSFDDMVRIIANYNTVYSDKKFKTDVELLSRGYTKEAIEALRKQQQQSFSVLDSCGIRFKSAFHEIKYDLYSYVEQLYSLYQRGILPFPGSVSEQPGQIMEIFNVFDSLQIERHNKEAKKRK